MFRQAAQFNHTYQGFFPPHVSRGTTIKKMEEGQKGNNAPRTNEDISAQWLVAVHTKT